MGKKRKKATNLTKTMDNYGHAKTTETTGLTSTTNTLMQTRRTNNNGAPAGITDAMRTLRCIPAGSVVPLCVVYWRWLDWWCWRASWANLEMASGSSPAAHVASVR
ncbi:uncharacterized protein [Drosophila pseudoobscura]|uniref:Uncharacterized protein n=1 Tax=Drosophila pseudoobscura pseudoobscura TaxID=46245 RepID=A0A6I8W5K5_DROPS|nr:uncharacterized protein LOC26533158 [Drosophila pseudoobscura]